MMNYKAFNATNPRLFRKTCASLTIHVLSSAAPGLHSARF